MSSSVTFIGGVGPSQWSIAVIGGHQRRRRRSAPNRQEIGKDAEASPETSDERPLGLCGPSIRRRSPMHTSTTHPPRKRARYAALAVAVTVTALGIVGTSAAPATVSAAGIDANDWLGVINTYRSQSGLAPVTENGSWASGTVNHSCWMLLNGIAHDETPGTPGYSAGGRPGGQQQQRGRVERLLVDPAEPHRPVDVGSVPHDRDPASQPPPRRRTDSAPARPTRPRRRGSRRRRST